MGKNNFIFKIKLGCKLSQFRCSDLSNLVKSFWKFGFFYFLCHMDLHNVSYLHLVPLVSSDFLQRHSSNKFIDSFHSNSKCWSKYCYWKATAGQQTAIVWLHFRSNLSGIQWSRFYFFTFCSLFSDYFNDSQRYQFVLLFLLWLQIATDLRSKHLHAVFHN